MHCTYSIEETKDPCLSLYSDSIGFNSGKRRSLYSDKHGGVKVKSMENFNTINLKALNSIVVEL